MVFESLCVGKTANVFGYSETQVCKNAKTSNIPTVMHTMFHASLMALGVVNCDGDVMRRISLGWGPKSTRRENIHLIETVVTSQIDRWADRRDYVFQQTLRQHKARVTFMVIQQLPLVTCLRVTFMVIQQQHIRSYPDIKIDRMCCSTKECCIGQNQ